MKNNELIQYKENIFIKIFNFFKSLFSRKKDAPIKASIQEESVNSKDRFNFLENIQINENEEEKELKRLQQMYDNGEIDEEDLSEEEIEKLVTLYEKETERLNEDTEKRKSHIAQMLSKLKQSES